MWWKNTALYEWCDSSVDHLAIDKQWIDRISTGLWWSSHFLATTAVCSWWGAAWITDWVWRGFILFISGITRLHQELDEKIDNTMYNSVSAGCLATSQWRQDSRKSLFLAKKYSGTYPSHKTTTLQFCFVYRLNKQDTQVNLWAIEIVVWRFYQRWREPG